MIKMSAKSAKVERLRAALSHREGDQVPTGEFFWSGFLQKCRAKWGEAFDPYLHFDLDYVVINPNMDPQIRPFEIISQAGEDIVLKTGFGAAIRRSGTAPMPHYDEFSIKAPEDMGSFALENPGDSRRFFAGGDDQINCIGDSLLRNIPSWDERIKQYEKHCPVFGSICEPYEYLWRIIGTENAMLWMGLEPDLLAEFIERVGRFLYQLASAEIEAGNGRIDGMYIRGDVAYVKGMLFGAPRWRELFKPHVKALIDLFHRHNLMVVYHGCGNAREIFDDLVDLGLDAYNPLETKAGLDVVDLKKNYAGRLAFIGNIDMRVLETGDPEKIRREVLYKLKAAKGGGWVFQSDHSISSNVTPESYELALKTLRQHGRFPLR